MTSEVLAIVLPVFILIGIGYFVAQIGLMSKSVGDALGEFVFVIAIPVLIFKTVARMNFGDHSPWALWAAYFSGMAITWLIGNLVIRKGFGREARAGVIGGIAAAFANTMVVGLPLISQLYGEAGLVPLLLIVSIHLPLTTVATVVLMERAAALDGISAPPPFTELVKRIAKNIATNPIAIAIAAALICRWIDVPIEGILLDVLNRIAVATGPVALLSLGISMVNYGIRGNVLPGVLLSLLKVAVMPALVFVAGAYVIGLPPLWTAVATMTATCPTGINAYVFANRYGTGHAMSANAITLTTAAAVVTSGLWFAFLKGWQGLF